MKKRKVSTLLIIILNIIGDVCLIYYAIPYLTHSTAISASDSMLPAEAWDSAGMALTLGFIPLLIVNILCFVFVEAKSKPVRFLYLVPTAVCLLIVLSYWIG